MPTPSELQALAVLRARQLSPSMAVFVTDDWRFAEKLADLGCLAVRVRPSEDHACDWSPVAGLHVVLAQWRTPMAQEARLAQALLVAKPAVMETLRPTCWGDVVTDDDGHWSRNIVGRQRRAELLLKLAVSP